MPSVIQVGFNTQVRYPRPQVGLNGSNEKARGINLSLASDVTAKLNGSSHQEAAKVKQEESSSDVALDDSSTLAAPVTPAEKQEFPPPSHSISFSAKNATKE